VPRGNRRFLGNAFWPTKDAFEAYLACRNACAMSVLQIGELASRLSEDFRERYDGAPRKLIRAMRNVFAHIFDGERHDEEAPYFLSDHIRSFAARGRLTAKNKKTRRPAGPAEPP
jgi:hypothetical protein